MNKVIVCALALLIVTCSSVFADNQKAYSYNPTEYTQKAVDVTPINHKFAKGFTCEYPGLCSVSFSTEANDDGPANNLIVVPYGNIMKAVDMKLIHQIDDEQGTMYLHITPIIKKANVYTLQFLTFISKDKASFTQEMFLFDAKKNAIDPKSFKLNDVLKDKLKQFIRDLTLPADAIAEILKTLDLDNSP